MSCAFLRSRLARLRFAFALETTVLQTHWEALAALQQSVVRCKAVTDSHDDKAKYQGGKTDASDRDQRYGIKVPTITLDPPSSRQGIRDQERRIHPISISGCYLCSHGPCRRGRGGGLGFCRIQERSRDRRRHFLFGSSDDRRVLSYATVQFPVGRPKLAVRVGGEEIGEDGIGYGDTTKGGFCGWGRC